MKKKVLFVAALFIGATAFAQDGLTSKKGEAYLPEAGDWALGFDGTPFLDYAGNMFNGTQNNSLTAGWVGNNNAASGVIYGKMFKDETTAYRLKIRIGMGSGSTTTMQDTATGTTLPFTGAVENKVSNSNGFTFVVGAGIEKRRGNTRIQGYYGGEILIGLIGGTSTTNEYGITQDSLNVELYGTAAGSRVTESSTGGRFTLGLRGFIGVEWFVSPKVSLGAEYGWGLAMNANAGSTGAGETTTATWNTTTNVIDTSTSTGPSSSDFSLDTDNGGARITIMFHF